MRSILSVVAAALSVLLLSSGAWAQSTVRPQAVIVPVCGVAPNTGYATATTFQFLAMDVNGNVCVWYNLSQIGGTTVLTGAGATGPGSQRVTVAQDSTTVAGMTPATGHGTAAGALRVELPTDGTGLVGLNASENVIGKTVSPQTPFSSATFTGTTGAAHAINKAICTSASPCVPLQFTLGRVASGTGRLTGFQVRTDFITSPTNLAPRVYFFKAAPTVVGVIDAGNFNPLWADAANSLGYVDCLTQSAYTDSIQFQCTFPNGANFLDYISDASGIVYAVMVQSPNAPGTYTTGTSQNWRLTATALQN